MARCCSVSGTLQGAFTHRGEGRMNYQHPQQSIAVSHHSVGGGGGIRKRRATIEFPGTSLATSPFSQPASRPVKGGILALRAHCALLLDYVPPEEPLGTPLGNTLRIRRPKLDWRGP